MGKILKGLEKVKDGFLKAYNMQYDVDGKPYTYELVSRNDLQDPSQLGQTANAVAIVPIFRDGTILVCREFRYAINDYCYEFPAGLIDPGETVEQAAIRELSEETGLKVEEILAVLPAGYSSAEEFTKAFDEQYNYWNSPEKSAERAKNLAAVLSISIKVLNRYTRGGKQKISLMLCVNLCYKNTTLQNLTFYLYRAYI